MSLVVTGISGLTPLPIVRVSRNGPEKNGISTKVNKRFTLTTSKTHINKPFKVLHTSRSVTEKPYLQ